MREMMTFEICRRKLCFFRCSSTSARFCIEPAATAAIVAAVAAGSIVSVLELELAAKGTEDIVRMGFVMGAAPIARKMKVARQETDCKEPPENGRDHGADEERGE